MNKVIFASDSLTVAPILAAALFNKVAGAASVAGAAVPEEGTAQKNLQKVLGAAGLEFPGTSDLAGIDIFACDLLIFFREVGGDHSYPSLPGMPPYAAWFPHRPPGRQSGRVRCRDRDR